MIVVWLKSHQTFPLISNRNVGNLAVDGYRAWKLYMAVKLHFTTNKYNVFNNRGHVKGARETFYSRNDRFIFERLSRKFATEQEIIQYYVANFAYGNESVVYADSESESNLVTWNKRKQSISQVFENDLHSLVLHLEKERIDKQELFRFNGSDLPIIFKLFLGGYITIETMVILDKFTGYLARWQENINLLLEDEWRRIEKCKGFVKFDSERLLQVYENFNQEILELQS
jgi:hypothetical protein